MGATNLAAILAPILTTLFILSLVAGLAWYYQRCRKADDKKRLAQRQSQRERSRSSQASLPLQQVQQAQQQQQVQEPKKEPQPEVYHPSGIPFFWNPPASDRHMQEQDPILRNVERPLTFWLFYTFVTIIANFSITISSVIAFPTVLGLEILFRSKRVDSEEAPLTPEIAVAEEEHAALLEIAPQPREAPQKSLLTEEADIFDTNSLIRDVVLTKSLSEKAGSYRRLSNQIMEPSTSPSRVALPQSPMPRFDLSTTIPKPPSPTRLKRESPQKEIKDYGIPVFDFSMKGNTAQKPAALRRKPLMATAGQAVSHVFLTAKAPGVAMEVPDKPPIMKTVIVPESAIGVRVKQAHEVPLPASPMPLQSSRMLNRPKQAPETVPLPASPMPVAAARLPTKPSMRAAHMRSSSEASQKSVATLEKLSPGTKKHVAPQLLHKPTPKTTPTGIQYKRKERQAAKSALDGSGFGLSPAKAVKPPGAHIGPAKTHESVDGVPLQLQSPAAGSPKLERQVVGGQVFLVSNKPLKLQPKNQGSPRSGRAGSASPKAASSKGKSPESHPVGFGVVKGGQTQVPSSKNRLVSDSSAAADDERGKISNHRPELERKISESEAHVLAVDPKIHKRKPSSRRINTVSDSIISNTSKHYESIEYQAKQYISHTFSKNALLDLNDGFQKEITTNPLAKSSPIKGKKVPPEEAAYQAMIRKAYIDERPKLEAQLSRARTRHRYGSSGQTQIASDVREESSSEFSVDFLQADESQKIIQKTYNKLDIFGGRSQEKSAARSQLSPVREPLSPSKSTKFVDGDNFAKRKGMSPSKRVPALELELPVTGMPSHGHGFELSSDHPLSPLKNRSTAYATVPSTSAIVDDDAFEHFDDVSLDDDLVDELVYHGTSIEELDKRATELEVMLDAMEKSQRFEVDTRFVDRAAELGLMVEAVEKNKSLQGKVDRQLLRELAATMTDTTTTTTTAGEVPHKSAMSMSHRSSVSSHKSVRWDPSIDSADSAVVQEKIIEEVSKDAMKEKKYDAELNLQKLFVQADEIDLEADEAEELGLLVKTLKAKGGGKNSKFASLLKQLRVEMENGGSGDEEKVEAVRVANVANVASMAKLNPLSPEFTPRNVKENDAWAPTQALEAQKMDRAMSVNDVDAWSKPNGVRDVGLHDPAIVSFRTSGPKVDSQNLFHDPAILSVSPGRMRANGFDIAALQQPVGENFVESLFTAGDPAILSIRQSPGGRLRATSQQISATAVSVPCTAVTQNVRKRVIWDNPNEPGGREAIIQSKKYSEECLDQFRQKYPMTGQKAKVLPKKKLEDLPKKYKEEALLDGTGALKPQKLATDAADIQQKLELLLLKKKEAKVRKMREGSGSGQNMSEWGFSSVPATMRGEAT